MLVTLLFFAGLRLILGYALSWALLVTGARR
jgi:hypothetical protein